MVTVAGFLGRALGQGGVQGVVLGSEEGATCWSITREEGQSSTEEEGVVLELGGEALRYFVSVSMRRDKATIEGASARFKFLRFHQFKFCGRSSL